MNPGPGELNFSESLTVHWYLNLLFTETLGVTVGCNSLTTAHLTPPPHTHTSLWLCEIIVFPASSLLLRPFDHAPRSQGDFWWLIPRCTEFSVFSHLQPFDFWIHCFCSLFLQMPLKPITCSNGAELLFANISTGGLKFLDKYSFLWIAAVSLSAAIIQALSSFYSLYLLITFFFLHESHLTSNLLNSLFQLNRF